MLWGSSCSSKCSSNTPAISSSSSVNVTAASVISSTSFGNHSYPVFLHAFLMISSFPFIFVIARSTYPATSRCEGGFVVPWMIPSAIIHNSHCFLMLSLNCVLKPTSTG